MCDAHPPLQAASSGLRQEPAPSPLLQRPRLLTTGSCAPAAPALQRCDAAAPPSASRCTLCAQPGPPRQLPRDCGAAGSGRLQAGRGTRARHSGQLACRQRTAVAALLLLRTRRCVEPQPHRDVLRMYRCRIRRPGESAAASVPTPAAAVSSATAAAAGVANRLGRWRQRRCDRAEPPQ
jgi:hypothetical protein